MKSVYIFFFLLFSISAYSQTTVNVDAGNVLRTLSGNENGINLDYLMDGSYLSPAISTTQSLKNIKARLLRYPGGEKSDNYLFSKAPYNSASPRMALNDTCFWPTNDFKFVDTNSAEKLCRPAVLDFDEFISMCNSVGASPLVVVAYDAAYNNRICNGKPTKNQLLTNAVEWVRYANVTKGWNVKYWMIGNESWNNAGYNGKVTPAQYAIDIEDFATAMKAVDPTIKIIANGKSGWWQTILESSAVSLIDYLGFSEYPVLNYTGGYGYYRQNSVNLTTEVDYAIDDINTYAPAPHKSRIKVIATEYNSIDWNNDWLSSNNLGHAIVNFQMFGDMVVKPKLEAACMWNTRWVDNASNHQGLYDAFDNEGNQNATAKSIDIWGSNLLSSMVTATSNGDYVKSYASYDAGDKKLNIFLINKDYSAKQVDLSIDNYLNDFTGSVWQLTGTSVDDKFPVFERTDSIFDPSDISSISLPANSVTVLKLQSDDVALPVKLVKFEAKKNDTGISLNWETSDEKNLSEYIIERSNDGSIFTAIGNVIARNEDSSIYSFVDTKIYDAPVIYYRLIVVNEVGEKVSSRVVSVTVSSVRQKIIVHPNPFDGILKLKISSDADKMNSVIIIDINGKIVYREKRMIKKGNNLVELKDLAGLQSGMYLVKVGDDQYSGTVKVIKR